MFKIEIIVEQNCEKTSNKKNINTGALQNFFCASLQRIFKQPITISVVYKIKDIFIKKKIE